MSRIRQFGKVLGPDPAYLVAGVVLVLGQPELAFFGYHVEDLDGQGVSTILDKTRGKSEPGAGKGPYLSSLIRKVGVSSFDLGRGDVELEKRRG